MELLFVYGTLMLNMNSAMARFLAANSTFWGEATMTGYLYDLGAYPGAVFDQNADSRVQGNLFQLHDPEKIFEVLDAYEGIDPEKPAQNEYRRDLIPVDFQANVINCWAYLYNATTKNLQEIPHGNYYEYVKNNPVHLRFIENGR